MSSPRLPSPIWSAAVLGWDAAQRAAEIENYVARVSAERDSQDRTDDAAADAVRVAAPEVRAGLRDEVRLAG